MENLSVSILGREYRLACTPDEKEALLKSAQLVDSKMQTIREAGKVMGADRIAVMAALQFAHELLAAAKVGDGVEAGEVSRRVRAMLQVCDEALLPQEKLF
ncbi:MAG: cell division protein ZapA [Pseudomonadota bacterium]|jgi:cell division protein ZapA|nr:cell division protein ZapA [Burkholderiaceae bacterium]MDQ3189730.1 cell division protein ZapA [Pseudomonadota bacterium]